MNYSTIQKYKAYCLSSKSINGKLKNFNNLKGPGKCSLVILAVDSLSPDEVFGFDPNFIKAVILRNGSLADHTAVLLNNADIQLAIVEDFPNVQDDIPVFINGMEQYIEIGSANTEQIKIENNIPSQSTIHQTELSYKNEKLLVCVDGKSASDLQKGFENGASGIGILRTEWIGWSENKPPSETTHRKLYSEAVKLCNPHQLNIRLFDLGGDKIPKWASSHLKQLRSPLGYRGIRVFELFPGAFKSQIEAIVKLSEKHRVGMILPMINDVDEIHFIKEVIQQKTFNKIGANIQIGAMIETPAAALSIDQILNEVDFIRIGPGDLTQFTLAKLRKNVKVTEFSGNNFHHSVMSLIEIVARKCQQRNKPLSVCLDIEPREPILQSLLNVGLRSFCVSPQNVEITKIRLENVTFNS